MDTSKIVEPRAFHVDSDWYDAYWMRQGRPHAGHGIYRGLALSLTRLGGAACELIRARRAAAEMPSEGWGCVGLEHVAHAKKLLLGVEGQSGGGT
jgi:hypothetical protein